MACELGTNRCGMLPNKGSEAQRDTIQCARVHTHCFCVLHLHLHLHCCCCCCCIGTPVLGAQHTASSGAGSMLG